MYLGVYPVLKTHLQQILDSGIFPNFEYKQRERQSFKKEIMNYIRSHPFNTTKIVEIRHKFI